MSLDFDLCKKITENISRVIVGKKESIELLLAALLADGHVLIEDIPGLGKTLLAKSLAKSIAGSFRRVQFTPDLLPADITGFNIYNQQTGQLSSSPDLSWPISCWLMKLTAPFLAPSPACLKAWRNGKSLSMARPIPCPIHSLSWLPQNPIELEGTFSLPEAQLDRFLSKYDWVSRER